MKSYLWIVLFLVNVPSAVFGTKLEFLASATLPSLMKFKKTRIGGLSAIWYDAETSALYSVSDDRGTINEPRLYRFEFKFSGRDLKITPQEVIFVKKPAANEGTNILDLEGMAPLPWGNFLLTNEGDNNKKPRVPPQLLDVKKNGQLIRGFEVPEKFLPEKTGKQKKGVRNNLGFEGLTVAPQKNFMWAFAEGPLLQDSVEDWGPIRVVQYEMPEAWIIKPTKEYAYRPEGPLKSDLDIILGAHVSEALALSGNEFLVLERSLRLSPRKMGFRCQVFLSRIDSADDISKKDSLKKEDINKLKTMKKELIFDFDTIRDQLGGWVDNFEGMSFGPLLDGKKTIIFVSDDNFKRIQKTQFVLFKLNE